MKQCTCSCSIGRRGFLAGAAALAAGVAQAVETPHRIDVHHHVVPPTWFDALKRAKLDNLPMSSWTPQRSIEDMDAGGIATAITSPTTPQVGFLPAADAARVAREANEYAKRLMADHPGRFGVFAMLPMPYIDECLKEIEYVFDTLKVDGIGMMTSYGDKWLGYPQFAPVFEELNRRKATVYTHPTTANCCVNLVQGLSDATVEWRRHHAHHRQPDLQWRRATLRRRQLHLLARWRRVTAVAERLQIQMVGTPPYKGRFTREMVDGQLRRFYYDTAQVANAVTIGALAKLVPVSQIVFGTDYPYRTGAEHARGLAAHFGADELNAIDRGNALRILPRLGAA